MGASQNGGPFGQDTKGIYRGLRGSLMGGSFGIILSCYMAKLCYRGHNADMENEIKT